MDKPRVIAIVGPTASGKSAMGVWLAKKINGEIISADSRQVYKGLDIGTGKVTKKEMAGIPHHLLSVATPKKQFSADDFIRLGKKSLADIAEKSKTPIVLGGTGFYLDALLGNVMLPQVPPNPALRKELDAKDIYTLFAILQKLDPRRAQKIEPHHKRRLIRAIEIAKGKIAGGPPADFLRRQAPQPSQLEVPFDTLWLGIYPDAETLRKNIHARLLARIKKGMVAEAKRLHTQGLSYKRMEELGLEYRLLAQYLRKKISYEQLLEAIERGNQQYAKRQMRWFKRNKNIKWIKNKAEALKLAKAFLSR